MNERIVTYKHIFLDKNPKYLEELYRKHREVSFFPITTFQLEAFKKQELSRREEFQAKQRLVQQEEERRK